MVGRVKEESSATPNSNKLNDASSSIVMSSSSSPCWKCHGHGKKYQKSTKAYDGTMCKVCHGRGVRPASLQSQLLSHVPGQIPTLRGYPAHHPLRRQFPDGFAGPRAVWGSMTSSRTTRKRKSSDSGDEDDNNDDSHHHHYHDRSLPSSLQPRPGEIVASLGCGDWRIYQISHGNKLTVDDFVCAYVAAEEMQKRGYCHPKCNMFGGVSVEKPANGNDIKMNSTDDVHSLNYFKHADLGTGCGSVLMMVLWAFLGKIRSVGVEAQDVSFQCLRRGLEWNLGQDGTHDDDNDLLVRIRKDDLRSWQGDSVIRPPYQLITGTPPYFPQDSFVGSQNHDQKIRCRIPTRGGASDYIRTAARLLMDDNDGDNNGGVFCMLEAAFDKAEAAVLETVQECAMNVQRRVDVVTREGLPPRFSCWVMTKKSNKSEKENSREFPIETLTLRNRDLSRTDKYSAAMEKMGWVDFEKYKTNATNIMTS